MAKIEDLIAQIPDERLRKGIAAEVKALKKTKKFGLVFEEHLPETVRLPRLTVKPGELVALKRESGNQLWRVKSIYKNIGICDGAVEGYPSPGLTNKEFPVTDLVVVRSFGDAIYPALVPVDRVERGGPDKPWHLLINADNFHALQLLLYCYEGKVDVIYIDPPYNTGARDWKYNNDYVDKTDSFRHSKWLAMIRRRLLLAKRLLKPTGVLIIAIDDNEVHHLRCLVDSIFSPELHMGTVCVRHKPGGTTTARKIARSHEYAFFYAASTEVAPCMVMRTEEQLSRFKHSDKDGAFEWENFRKHGQGCRKDDRPRQHYPIWLSPKGKLRVPKMEYDDKSKNWIINELLPPGVVEIWPNKGKEKRVWLWSPENFTPNPTLFKYKNKKGEHCIYKKRRPNRVGVVPNTSWNDNGKRDDGTPLPGEHLNGRNLSEGFEENFEYARLDFLEPSSVARGDAFQAILPILWMMAGCHGKREDSKGSQAWFIPKHAPFAVLIKEKEFRAFRETLAERKDIEWVFLVTDSEENFGLMRRKLGRKFQCLQLYKSYLENFRINTPEALGQGGAA